MCLMFSVSVSTTAIAAFRERGKLTAGRVCITSAYRRAGSVVFYAMETIIYFAGYVAMLTCDFRCKQLFHVLFRGRTVYLIYEHVRRGESLSAMPC